MQRYSGYRGYAAGIPLVRADLYYRRRNGRRAGRWNAVFIAVLVLALLTLCAVGAVWMLTPPKSVAARGDAPDASLPPMLPDAEGTAAAAIPISAAPPEEAAKEDGDALPSVIDGYDYGAPVPEREAVDDDWFSDAVFIGDSRIVGLSMHGGLRSTWYGLVGLNISNLDKKEYVELRDGEGNAITLTAMDALRANDNCGKVYLSLGLNELGWTSVSLFASMYADAVREIREIHPDAQIYVMDIIPLTSDASDATYSGNVRVREYNELLAKLCADERVYYLDLYSYFADDDGVLPNGEGSDGVHLTKAAYMEWADYLRTHTVDAR